MEPDFSWFPPTLTILGTVVVALLTFLAAKKTRESQRFDLLWNRIDTLETKGVEYEKRLTKQDQRARVLTEYAWALRGHIQREEPPPPPPWPILEEEH